LRYLPPVPASGAPWLNPPQFTHSIKKFRLVTTHVRDPIISHRALRVLRTIATETEILSDSATNLLNLYGKLPRDREKLLGQIDRYLDLSSREKILFHLQARLESFVGQYGGLIPEILEVLRPYLSGSRLNIAAIADRDAIALTRMVRARLMP
jgi:hypothetical protein